MDDKLQDLTGYALVDHNEAWPLLERLPVDADQAFEECISGRALMFMGPPGWFVVSLRPGENPGTLELFVLLAIGVRHGAFEEAEPAVLAIARDLAATTVAFRSVRRGWARRLGPAWRPRGKREFWRHV